MCSVLTASLFLSSQLSILFKQPFIEPYNNNNNNKLFYHSNSSDVQSGAAGEAVPSPGSQTILATIDFSKAFDSVWHPNLFHKLISAGLPPCFACWTQSLLSDGALAWFIKITKAAPFESVEVFRKDPFLALYFSLSSIIFRLLYLSLSASFFTLTIWPFGPPPPRSPQQWRPHKELYFDWSAGPSTGNFLSIRANVRPSYFQLIPYQANLQPDLLLFNSRLRFNPTPTFLGVTFDRTLSFSKHIHSLKAMFLPRLKALRCISASSWGLSEESLFLLYKSFLPPLLTYSSPEWFPFLSVTNITKLERLNRAASCTITGCLLHSSIPLLSEASLPPLRVTLAHFALSFYERVLRLPASFPISDLARLEVKPRLCRLFCSAFSFTHPLMLPSTSSRKALFVCPPSPP